MRKRIILLAAMVLMASALPVLAQQPTQQPAQQQAATAQGQLQKVDSAAMTIVIRNAQGTLMTFRYTDQTKVTGTDEEVAGLATKAGADVNVRFVHKDQENIATEIQVLPKK
jgi:Cu/Ag efflux protein CusF